LLWIPLTNATKPEQILVHGRCGRARISTMLGVGTRLGSYEVLTLLGAGGMGEVYRAHDSRLGRDVALKILPEAFRSDPERLARFEREARALAALNHPNIAAIYGIEEQPGATALVLEFVEGETLADIIQTSGGLPVADALNVARQIADALDAAHEKGIIHRDLKPANITITPGEVVKVLDFGLAKAIDPVHAGLSAADLSNSPTMSTGGTRAGMILGTAAYRRQASDLDSPAGRRRAPAGDARRCRPRAAAVGAGFEHAHLDAPVHSS
jgi:serine/threonine protein kinase